MDMKNLRFCQVRWAQKLSQYHFKIDYCQGKANVATDALFCFAQRSQTKEEILRDKNTQILHRLQTSLTKANLARLSSLGHQTVDLLPLYQMLIYKTLVLPRLCPIWAMFQGKLAYKKPYQASIRGLRLQLPELQAEDQEAQKLREQGLKDGWDENVDGVLYHQGLPYMPEIVKTDLIHRHHDDPLAGHFGIDKT